MYLSFFFLNIPLSIGRAKGWRGLPQNLAEPNQAQADNKLSWGLVVRPPNMSDRWGPGLRPCAITA